MSQNDHTLINHEPKVALPKPGIFSISNQIRYGLILFVGLSLLLTSSILIYLSFQTQLQQVELLQHERSRAAANEINIFLDDLQRKLGYLARVRGLTDLEPAIQHDLLEGLIRHNRAYAAVAILNSERQVVSSVSPYGQPPNGNLADAAFFLQSFTQQDDFMGQVEFDPELGLPIIALAVPIRNQQDEIDGVLLAHVTLEFLWFVVSQTDVGQSGYVYILDNRNFLIADRASSPENFILKDLSEQAFIQNLMLGDEADMNAYQGLTGQNVLGSMASIGNTHWNVVAELPTREAYAPIQNMLRVMGLALGLVTLVTIGLSLFLSRQIVRPLQQLTTTATQISAGQLDVQVKVKSHNELGILAITFNDMTTRLRRVINSLNQRLLELNQAQEELRIGEERYRTLYNQTPIMMHSLDHEGRLVSINAYWLKTLGYKTEEALGHKAIDFLTEDSRRYALDVISPAHLKTGVSRDVAYQFVKKNGEVIDVVLAATTLHDAQGKFKQTLAVIRDVTAQKRADEALRKWGHLFEHAGWGIAVRNSLTGNIEMLNPALAEMYGATIAQLTDSPMLDLFAPNQQAALAEYIGLAQQKGHLTFESEHVHQDGSIFPVLVDVTVVKDDAGQEMYQAMNIQDISKRKQAEAQIKNSLHEKEILLKEIHHRVKNNLQIISGLLDLQSGYIKDEQARQVFRESRHRIKSMALIHERLYQTETLATIDFADYINSLVGYLRRSYGAMGIKLQVRVAPVSLTIEQAIPCGLITNELVSNAIKHAFSSAPSQRSGDDHDCKICIELQISEEQNTATDLYAAKDIQSFAGRQLTLSVRDNGGGFPPEVDFRRTKSLGLTLVMTLVKQIKGTIQLQSEGGTEFKIIFTGR